MAEEVGYRVVHFAGILDMFLLRKDLLEGICPPSLSVFSNRVRHFHMCVEDPSRKQKWMDYPTYMKLIHAYNKDKRLENQLDIYNCTNEEILHLSRRAATEQYLLIHKPTDNYAATASCMGFV